MTILAEGSSREGDRWQLVLDQVDEDNQVTSIRVVSQEGRTSQGGYGDRSLRPEQRIAWYGGWDDEGGPNRAIVRVSRDISRLRVRLSNGREESPDLVPHPIHDQALIAALVYPHDVTIDGVDTVDVNGTVTAEEVPAFLRKPDHGMPRRPR